MPGCFGESLQFQLYHYRPLVRRWCCSGLAAKIGFCLSYYFFNSIKIHFLGFRRTSINYKTSSIEMFAQLLFRFDLIYLLMPKVMWDDYLCTIKLIIFKILFIFLL